MFSFVLLIVQCLFMSAKLNIYKNEAAYLTDPIHSSIPLFIHDCVEFIQVKCVLFM